MKKLLLIVSILFVSIQTFSFSPKNSARANVSYIVPGNLNGLTIQEFLKITPKKYQELTGKKMTFKQKLSFFILKAKLKKQLPDEKVEGKKSNLGLLSLIFGGAAFIFALIPGIAVVSLPLAIAAIVLGILGLGKMKGDTKSVIGLVLGSVFILLAIAAVAVFASFW